MGVSASDVYSQSWEHLRHVENERYWFLTTYQAIALALIAAIAKILGSPLHLLSLILAELGLFASASTSLLGLFVAITLRAAYTSHLRVVKKIYLVDGKIRSYYPYWMGDEPWGEAGFVDLPHKFAKLGTSFHGIHISIFRSTIFVVLASMTLLPVVLGLLSVDSGVLREALIITSASATALTWLFYCWLFRHVRRGLEESAQLLKAFLEGFCQRTGGSHPQRICEELEGAAEFLGGLADLSRQRFLIALLGALLADVWLGQVEAHLGSFIGFAGFLAGQAIVLGCINLTLNDYLRAADDADRLYSTFFVI